MVTNSLLSVVKTDGTKIDAALKIIKISCYKNPNTQLRPQDLLRPFYTRKGKNGRSIHFLLNNSRVKVEALVMSPDIGEKDILTIDAIE